MDRRQPGYLIPSERRLEHLYTVAVRNLTLTSAKHHSITPPSVFFQIVTADGTIAYRSELLAHTSNPTWAPLEWALIAETIENDALEFNLLPEEPPAPGGGDSSPAHSLSKAHAVLLLERHLDLRRDVHFLGFDVFDALAQLNPSSLRVPGGSAAAAAALRERTEGDLVIVDLAGLQGSTAAAYSFEAMPVNTLILALDDGHYLPRETAWQLLGISASQVRAALAPQLAAAEKSSKSAAAAAGGAVATSVGVGPTAAATAAAPNAYGSISVGAASAMPSGGFGRRFDAGLALHSIATLQHRTLEAAEANAARTRQMRDVAAAMVAADRLALFGRSAAGAEPPPFDKEEGPGAAAAADDGAAPTASRRASSAAVSGPPAFDLVRRAVRVAEMRAAVAALEEEVCEEEAAVVAQREALTVRVAGLSRALRLTQQAAAFLPAMQREVECVRGEVGLLRTLVTAKQLSLLAELRALYPVEEIALEQRGAAGAAAAGGGGTGGGGGRTYTIRGLHLPSDLHTLPEEQVSTALGYVCHLVQLAAKYLAVPLRYTPAHCASHSCMRDDVIAPGTEYPLYGKVPPAASPEAAASPLSIAVLMLARDVKQLLHAQGLAMGDAHMLGALRRLFSVLLDAPVPTAAAAAASTAAAAGAAAAAVAAAGGGTG